MANQEHLDKLKEGVEAWNRWRAKYRGIQPDLSDANLSGADLSNADLSVSILSNTDLSNADLSFTNLSVTILSNANLDNAYLRSANLSSANLSNADLSVTNLRSANLSNADLDNADLSFATLHNTILSNIDFRTIKGLLEIQHGGPSKVELYSVKLPQDGSALHFLRGAGVPNEWIDFYRATMHHPIQYHSCFISYSSEDYEIAKRFHADLQDQGVRCWFAPHDLVPGDYFREKIDQAIHMQDKLLLILSTHSINSHWVQYEVRKALNREVNQNRTILFPISLDGSVFKSPSAWAQELREERHIGDFTQWETYEVYKQKFQMLLKQLKATEVKP